MTKTILSEVSFKLDKIVPEYWGERLHFTRLDGEVRYPAETLENKGMVRLNGGLKINGARIRHEGFGFAPVAAEAVGGGDQFLRFGHQQRGDELGPVVVVEPPLALGYRIQ